MRQFLTRTPPRKGGAAENAWIETALDLTAKGIPRIGGSVRAILKLWTARTHGRDQWRTHRLTPRIQPRLDSQAREALTEQLNALAEALRSGEPHPETLIDPERSDDPAMRAAIGTFRPLLRATRQAAWAMHRTRTRPPDPSAPSRGAEPRDPVPISARAAAAGPPAPADRGGDPPDGDSETQTYHLGP